MNAKYLRNVSVILTMMMNAGCATTRDSVLLGAGIGAGAGGVAGHFANQDGGAGPTLLGAAIGAVTGGVLGALFHSGHDKTAPTGTPGELPAKPLIPLLTRPEVRSIWVPDKIDTNGTRWEQGHYLFFIEKQSTFSD